MEVEAAEGGDGDGAGTSAPLARQAGAWNKHDDAAVAGILAAARAAGATGASVRYGGVVTKVWFEPQGSDQDEVNEKMKRLQLATDGAEARRLGAFLYITGSFTFGSTAGMFVDQLRNPGRPLRALWSNPGTNHTTVRAGMWSSATAMAHSSAALAHKASAKSERFVVHTVIYRNAPSPFHCIIYTTFVSLLRAAFRFGL